MTAGMRARLRRVLLGVCLVTAVGEPPAAAQAPVYTVQEIAAPGVTEILGRAVNATGEVVGTARFPGRAFEDAFHWHDGILTFLGDPTWSRSRASLLTDAGDVAGYDVSTANIFQPFVVRNGTKYQLPLPGGAPLAMNNAGVVLISAAGRMLLADPAEGPAGVRDISPAVNGSFVDGRLTESGYVFGNWKTDGETRGFLYIPGDSTAVLLDPGRQLLVDDVNESGVVVGRWQRPDGVWRGFRYEEGEYYELPGEMHVAKVRIGDNGRIAIEAGTNSTYLGVLDGTRLTWTSGVHVSLYGVAPNGIVAGTLATQNYLLTYCCGWACGSTCSQVTPFSRAFAYDQGVTFLADRRGSIAGIGRGGEVAADTRHYWSLYSYSSWDSFYYRPIAGSMSLNPPGGGIASSARLSSSGRVVAVALGRPVVVSGNQVYVVPNRVVGGDPFVLGSSTFAIIGDSGHVTVRTIRDDGQGAYLFSPAADVVPPTAVATLPDPPEDGWHRGSVPIQIAGYDVEPGSGVKEILYGLSGAVRQGFTIVAGDSASLSIATAGTTTLTYVARDFWGNESAPQSVTIRLIDPTPPAIDLRSPFDGAVYARGQSVRAHYSCSDPTPPVTCVGDVEPGTAIDTSTSGTFSFTVHGTDGVGNSTSTTATYTIREAPLSEWQVAAPLPEALRWTSAVPLPTGKVLLAGGFGGAVSATSWLYGLADNEWQPAGSLHTARFRAPYVPLDDGRVMVAGGRGHTAYLDTAEIFDWGTSSWTPVASMRQARFNHAAVRLTDGRVLVVGGSSQAALFLEGQWSAEIYDPHTNSWTPTEAMGIPRFSHTASLLPDGRVLIAGGRAPTGATASVEIFDPETNRFTPGPPLPGVRESHGALSLPDGRVLVAGGTGQSPLSDALLYQPDLQVWAPAGEMSHARAYFEMVLLADRRVLVAGGRAGSDSLVSAEVFDPLSGMWTPVHDMHNARYLHAIAALPGGGAIVAGGVNTANTDTVEIWNASRSLTPADTTPPVLTPHVTGTLGDNGWYTSDVTVAWSVTDEDSPVEIVAGCVTSQITADTDGLPFGCTAASGGGESSASITIKRDATPPGIAITSPEDGREYYTGLPLRAAYTCTDALALAACEGTHPPGAAIDTTTPGDFTFTVTARDEAGHITTRTIAYTVSHEQASFHWTLLPAAGPAPAPRTGHGLAYDSLRGRVILFGGQGLDYGFLNDVWEFDPATRTWTDVTPPAGAPAPLPRAQFGMAYDVARDRVIVYAGTVSFEYSNVGMNGETWEWDPATRSWSNAPAAGSIVHMGLFSAELAYDPVRQQVILFGGQPYWGWPENNGTYAFDGAAWIQVPVAGPAGRIRHAMWTANGRVRMYGGHSRYPVVTPLADLWEWDGTSWRQIADVAGETAWLHPSIAWDPRLGADVRHGGAGSGATRSWDGAGWSALPIAGSAPGARWTRMAFAESTGELVMFGGNSGAPHSMLQGSYGPGGLGDTWIGHARIVAPTTLTIEPLGQAGGSVTVRAQLQGPAGAIAGRTILIALGNGLQQPVTTGADGYAAATFSLAGIGPGTYAGYVSAGFAGDAQFMPSEASADLTVIDNTPPSIQISSPGPGAVFARHAQAFAEYTCSDAGSGIATCAGPVASGAALDTSTPGTFTFNVAATDVAGNTATASATYTVAAVETIATGEIFVGEIGANRIAVYDGATHALLRTLAVDREPYSIVFDGQYLWTTHAAGRTVTAVDPQTGALAHRFPTGQFPTGLAVLQNPARVYVANWDSHTVTVVDLEAGITRTLGSGWTRPLAVLAMPDQRHVWISNSGSSTIHVLDVLTETIVDTIAVGSQPSWLALSPDARHVLSANYGSATVSVIDLATRAVVRTIAMGADLPASVSFTPDGASFLVSFAVPGGPVRRFDFTTGQMLAHYTIGNYPGGARAAPHGLRAYAGSSGGHTLWVVDLGTNQIAATVGTGFRPAAIVIAPAPAALSVFPATAPFAGAITVRATLTSLGAPVVNRRIEFRAVSEAAGVSELLGIAWTDGDGTASLEATLPTTIPPTCNADGGPAGCTSAVVRARFVSESFHDEATAEAPLTIFSPVPMLTWTDPEPITYGTPLGAPQLNATADVPGTFTYTPPAGTILDAGTHTLGVLFTPADSANYTTASASAEVEVRKALPTVVAADTTVTFDGTPKAIVHAATGALGEPLGPLDLTYAGGPVAPAAAGTYAAIVTFAGAANYEAGSASATLRIEPAFTMTSLQAPAASVWGEEVRIDALVAAVPPGGGIRTGTVQFFDGEDLLGAAPVAADGAATLVTSSLAIGGHAITALYGGDANFLGSAAAAVTHDVAKAASALTLTSSPNPSGQGEPVVIRVEASAVAPGAGLPEGSIELFANGAALGVAPLVEVDGRAVATFSTTSLAAGTHVLTASYAGDAHFLGAAGDATSHVVNPRAASTTTAVTLPASAPVGEAVTIEAAVSSQAGGSNPEGTVEFFAGDVFLGRGPLALARGAMRASIAVPFDTAGAYQVVARYVPSGEMSASASAPGSVTIYDPADGAPIATRTSINAPRNAAYGEAVVAKVTVRAAGNGPTPTGAVEIYVDGILTARATLVNGDASVSLIGLSRGTHKLVATYLGDGTCAGSTSAADINVVR
jgi:YVTN family beta-propeller protein